MERKIIFSILVMLLLLNSIFAQFASAWSFNDAPSYLNALNVTVGNWMYNPGYVGLSGNFLEGNVSYVMVRLVNISAPLGYRIVGYDPTAVNIGTISYQIVLAFKNTTILLLPNVTSQGLPWSKATIFYNNLLNQIGTINQSASSYTFLTPNNGSVTTIGYTLTGQPNGCQLITCIGPLGIFKSFNITSQFSNSPYTVINASLNLSKTKNLVVIANTPFSNMPFRLSYFPNFYTLGTVLSQNSRYSMQTAGLILPTTVTGPNVLAGTVNTLLFGSGYQTNNGFDAFLGTNINFPVLESQALRLFSCGFLPQCVFSGSTYVSNSSTAKGGFTFFNTKTGQFLMNYSNGNAISVWLLPGFTSNYTLSNTATNNNPIVPGSVCKGSIIQNCFSQFNFYYKVVNITFNSLFATQNFNALNNTEQPVTLTADNRLTHYFMLNTTHWAQMGNNCQYVYADVRTGVNRLYPFGQWLGSVPFYPVNCNATNKNVSFIFGNKTSLGFAFNTLNLYFGESNNKTIGLGNLSTFNAWRIVPSTSYANVNAVLPFTIQITSFFNNASRIQLNHTNDGGGGHSLSGLFTYNQSQNSDAVEAFKTGQPVIGTIATNPIMSFLYINQSWFSQLTRGFTGVPGTTLQILASPLSVLDLTATAPGNCAFFIWSTNNHQGPLGAINPCNLNNTVGIRMYGAQHPLAYAQYLYSTQANTLGPFFVKKPFNLTNSTLPFLHLTNQTNSTAANKTKNLTQVIGGNIINVNSTFNAKVTSLNNGYSLPYWLFAMLGIAVTVISGIFFKPDQGEEYALAFVIIGLFLMSTFSFNVIYLAAFLLILFVAAEFLRHKSKKDYKR